MPADEPYIAVVGPSDPDTDTYEFAVAAGRLIAEGGGVVVCGGLGGVMEAAALGASEGGGRSLGLLPGHDRGAANPYVTMAVATGLGELRNGLVVGTSDAVLAVGGSWGTLSEVALAVRRGTPVVSLRGWSAVDSGGAMIAGVIVTTSPTEAVAAIFQQICSVNLKGT